MHLTELSWTLETDDDSVVFRLVGELDISTAPRLLREIEEAVQSRPAELVIDLRDLEFMDSTGLRVVMQLDSRMRRWGGHLRLVKGPPAVQRLFEITSLDTRLDLADA